MSGYIYALLSALSNSMTGVSTRFSFEILSFYQIAFYKSFLAFVILSIIALFKPSIREQIKELWPKKHLIAVLSFCAIFVLSIFEAKAYSVQSIPIVSFSFYASGVLTIFLSYLILNEPITAKKLVGLVGVICGGIVILGELPASSNLYGVLYAMTSGLGYTMFIIFGRKFKIHSNAGTLWWLTGIGSFLLLLPSLFSDLKLGIPAGGFEYLLVLAIVPTLGGFFFTLKAVSKIEASKVHIVEMSDPLFSSVGALIFTGETLGLQGMIGASLILLGLFCVGTSNKKSSDTTLMDPK